MISTCLLVTAVAVGSQGAAADSITGVTAPDPQAPFAGWTAAQQWMPQKYSEPLAAYGYANRSGWLLVADELGPRLSQLGRASLIDNCFNRHWAEGDPPQVLAWALCADDLASFDEDAAEAELRAAGVADGERARVMADVQEGVARGRAVVASLDAAARTDPGLAAVRQAVVDAQTEWRTYLASHQADVDRYLAMKDAMRSGKRNHPGFAGCDVATRGAFEALVKRTAPTIPWDVGRDYLPGYMAYLVDSIDGYITTVAWAACAAATDRAGDAVYAAAANQDGGHLRAGWRTVALGKLLAPSFAPRFADRALSITEARRRWTEGVIMTGIRDELKITAEHEGVVATVAASGDLTHVTYAGGQVDACLDWRETRKVTGWSTGGDPIYEHVCARRGKVQNDVAPIDVPAAYLVGVGRGDSLATVAGFPVVAWRDHHLTMLLGVALDAARSGKPAKPARRGRHR